MVNPAPSRPSRSEGRPSLRLLRGAAVTPEHEQHFARIPNTVARCRQLSRDARATYAVLCSYAGNALSCWPSMDVLAADLGAHRNSVALYIGELVDRGFVRVQRRGQGKSNVYHIVSHCDDGAIAECSDPQPTVQLDAQPSVQQEAAACPVIVHLDPQPTVQLDAQPSVQPIKEERDSLKETHLKETQRGGNPGIAQSEGPTPLDKPQQILFDIAEAIVLARESTVAAEKKRRQFDRLMAEVKVQIVDAFAGDPRQITKGAVVGCVKYLKTKPHIAASLTLITPKLVADELGPWLAAGKPATYQEPARRTRAAAGGEPPGPPPTEVETGGICYGCLATEGWPHKKHCARSGRVSNDNLVTWEEKNGRPWGT